MNICFVLTLEINKELLSFDAFNFNSFERLVRKLLHILNTPDRSLTSTTCFVLFYFNESMFILRYYILSSDKEKKKFAFLTPSNSFCINSPKNTLSCPIHTMCVCVSRKFPTVFEVYKK